MPYRIIYTPHTKCKKALNSCNYYVETITTGKLHSKHPIDYDTAVRQMHALYRASGKEASGGAFIPFLKSLPSRITGFFGGTRYNYRPQDRELLAKVGNEPIIGLIVMRKPLANMLDTLMNFLSLGKFDEIKAQNKYTDFYHLFVIVLLQNGSMVRIEKNQTIELHAIQSLPTEQAFAEITPSQHITLKQFLDNCEQLMGKKLYFTYDAKENNCQVYIYNLLKANGDITPEATEFIMQDIAELPEFTQNFARAVTDLGHRADILVSGAGLKKRRKKITSK